VDNLNGESLTSVNFDSLLMDFLSSKVDFGTKTEVPEPELESPTPTTKRTRKSSFAGDLLAGARRSLAPMPMVAE